MQKEYNKFIQSLEEQALDGMFYHVINQQIYVTDSKHKLVGIWDKELGQKIK